MGRGASVSRSAAAAAAGAGRGGRVGQGIARRRDATRGSGLLDRVLGVPSWALTLAAAARRFVPPSGQLIEAEEKRYGGSKFQCIWVPGTSFVLQYIRGCVGGNSDLGCACLPLLREAWCTLRCAAPATSRGTSYKLEVAGERPPLLPPVSSTSTSSYPTNAHVLTASFLPVIKSSPAQSSASLQLQLQLHSGTAAQAPAALAPSAPRPVAGRRASAVPGLARRSIQSSRASVPGDALPLTPDDALDATSLVQ